MPSQTHCVVWTSIVLPERYHDCAASGPPAFGTIGSRWLSGVADCRILRSNLFPADRTAIPVMESLVPASSSPYIAILSTGLRLLGEPFSFRSSRPEFWITAVWKSHLCLDMTVPSGHRSLLAELLLAELKRYCNDTKAIRSTKKMQSLATDPDIGFVPKSSLEDRSMNRKTHVVASITNVDPPKCPAVEAVEATMCQVRPYLDHFACHRSQKRL